MLDLTGDPRDFDSIANCDWPLRQNHQATDEIARDVLQTKPNTDANCPRENSQSAQMNAGVIEDNENADDQDDVADNLSDRVLQRAVETTLSEETVKQEPFRARREPKDCDQQRDQQKKLEETEGDARKWRVPRQ